MFLQSNTGSVSTVWDFIRNLPLSIVIEWTKGNSQSWHICPSGYLLVFLSTTHLQKCRYHSLWLQLYATAGGMCVINQPLLMVWLHLLISTPLCTIHAMPIHTRWKERVCTSCYFIWQIEFHLRICKTNKKKRGSPDRFLSNICSKIVECFSKLFF